MPETNIVVGALYIVATPIGNLDDISFRAVETLKQVDCIAAEDTRHSRVLLQHFSIKTPLIAYHEHNEGEQALKLVAELQQGKSIALISDAGTPLISDPGYSLVQQATAAGIRVIPIPGPCALISALCASGLPTDKFYFGGFLPAKKIAREKQLTIYAELTCTFIVYESPHRIIESLQSFVEVFGEDRHCVVARELTKKFETFYYGKCQDILQTLEQHPKQQQGEFIILIEGQKTIKSAEITAEAKRIFTLLREELPLKKAVNLVAEITETNKKELYDWGLSQANQSS